MCRSSSGERLRRVAGQRVCCWGAGRGSRRSVATGLGGTTWIKAETIVLPAAFGR
jgi:hypothetical protein